MLQTHQTAAVLAQPCIARSGKRRSLAAQPAGRRETGKIEIPGDVLRMGLTAGRQLRIDDDAAQSGRLALRIQPADECLGQFRYRWPEATTPPGPRFPLFFGVGGGGTGVGTGGRRRRQRDIWPPAAAADRRSFRRPTAAAWPSTRRPRGPRPVRTRPVPAATARDQLVPQGGGLPDPSSRFLRSDDVPPSQPVPRRDRSGTLSRLSEPPLGRKSPFTVATDCHSLAPLRELHHIFARQLARGGELGQLRERHRTFPRLAIHARNQRGPLESNADAASAAGPCNEVATSPGVRDLSANDVACGSQRSSCSGDSRSCGSLSLADRCLFNFTHDVRVPDIDRSRGETPCRLCKVLLETK